MVSNFKTTIFRYSSILCLFWIDFVRGFLPDWVSDVHNPLPAAIPVLGGQGGLQCWYPKWLSEDKKDNTFVNLQREEKVKNSEKFIKVRHITEEFATAKCAQATWSRRTTPKMYKSSDDEDTDCKGEFD